MATDNNILKDAENAYEMAWRGWADWLDQAEFDFRMYLGAQWDTAWYNYYTRNNRTASVWNRLARVIDIISGYERKTRKALKVAPIGFDDDRVSSQMSEVLMGDMKACDGYNQISDAFKNGPLITGRAYLELFMGVNNRLRVRRVMHNHILPDPTIVESDLSDADFIYHREMVTVTQAKRLLRGRRNKELQSLIGKMDNKFPTIPWAMRNFSEEMLTYDRFWEKTGRERSFLLDKQTGQQQMWTGSEERLRAAIFFSEGQLTSFKKWVDEVKLHIIVGGELMSTTGDPLGIAQYPYVQMTGNWNPEIDDDRLKLQGMVRRLRDPQREYNKRLSQEVDIVESTVQNGWVVEENVVIDNRSLFQAGQGKVIHVKENKLDKIKQLSASDIPQGQFQLTNLLEKQIPELAVINEEFFGTSEKDIPGVLGRLRQGSAVTGMQGYFDGKRRAFRQLGRLWMKASQSRYSPEQVQRIVGEQPDPNFFKADLVGYDCVTEEGLFSDTQREIYYAELLQLWNQTGGIERSPMPVTALIEAAPISMKSKLKDQIAENEKQRAKQAKSDLEDKELLREIQKAAIAEKMAEAEKNLSAANENQAEAALDRIRAIAEIEGIKAKTLIEAIRVVRELEQPVGAAK